jgi:hypothetical protein
MAGWLAAALTAGALAGCGGETSGSGGSGGSGGAGGATTSSASGSTTTGCTSTAELGAGECRGNEDCTESTASCVPPGVSTCGGAGCLLESCGIDSDCPSGDPPFVCEIDACCGDKRCVPGCVVDSDCELGFACTPDKHCVPQPCGSQACPANFDCGQGSVPSCKRRSCSCDAECDGTCVLGQCHTGPGTCELPAP